MRTIALEEHFWTAELAAPPGTGPLATWGQRVDDQLRDLGQQRLADMDANGIDLQVISHVAPLYLHPAPPSNALRDALYQGLPPAVAGRLATGAWGWHAEAGLHVLRMIATGVFDRHPGLRLIVGHCGEMVPFMLDRIDAMLDPARLGPAAMALKPSEYFLRNIWVTTSGLFSLPPVLCAVQVLGVDRVLFSVDYPFGDNAAGRALLDTLPLAPADKAKIAGGNAERLLGLKA